jgi:hypothetical protein
MKIRVSDSSSPSTRTQKNADESMIYLDRIAAREDTTASDLIKQYRLSSRELSGDHKKSF